MAQQVGKFAAQKLLRQQMKNYQSKKVETGDVRTPYASIHQMYSIPMFLC